MNPTQFEVRFFSSLYFRLLALYSLTFFLIVGAFGLAFRLSRPVGIHDFFQTNIQNYTTYLARDIGSPPDLSKAAEISRDTGLAISIRSPKVKWNSNEVDTTRRGHKIYEIHQGDEVFIFSGPDWSEESRHLGFLTAIALVALTLWLSYLLTRRIFRPIEWLKQSALDYSEGNWNSRVPVRGRDELSDLALTMNSMAERIQSHLQSMRELYISISHELRSPLTRMRVALEFLSDPKLKTSLNEEITLLDQMTESLLEQEKITRRPDLLEREEIDLVEFCRKIVEPYLSHGIGLDIKIEKARLFVDRNRFSIAVRNLLENAIKHAIPATAPPVLRLSQSNPKTFQLEIKDFGPGIPKTEIHRLGEAFFRHEKSRTGERAEGGFGLGISLSFSILKAHGAKVSVESDINQGTSFRITLTSV